jgi:hypothetical protein
VRVPSPGDVQGSAVGGCDGRSASDCPRAARVSCCHDHRLLQSHPARVLRWFLPGLWISLAACEGQALPLLNEPPHANAPPAGDAGVTDAAVDAGKPDAGTPDAGLTCGDSPTDRAEAVCLRWRCDRADLSEGVWSGITSSCNAGDMTAQARLNAVRQINLFRFLAQQPAVSHDATRDAKAQQCALMMLANAQLSHGPPPSWTCYSDSLQPRRLEHSSRTSLRRRCHRRLDSHSLHRRAHRLPLTPRLHARRSAVRPDGETSTQPAPEQQARCRSRAQTPWDVDAVEPHSLPSLS